MATTDNKSLETEIIQLKKKSFRVISQLNNRIKELEGEIEHKEPIAIIGMSCRFPGGSDSPEALWDLLSAGRDGIEPIPQSRWDIEQWYDTDPEAAGKMYVREGGFVKGIEAFDPSFFKISPQEARSMDPQQRLLLECSWEALERAGLRQTDLSNTNTGVYIGISGNDYLVSTSGDTGQMDAYSLLGSINSAIAGRIAYWLGLTGPNMVVDTACSSSLVSLHLGVQALRQGECDQAIVGGVSLLLSPAGMVYLSKIKSLSPTGRCHTFSNQADGFIRGEGAGVLVLKPLSKAKADGDPILALVKGTGVNQDGKSQGFTAPNGPSQQQVIKKALAEAQLQPSDIGYIECHGTGTDLGDPIEVQSIGAVFKDNKKPVVLSSIKSNIGHAEAAAGVAGVIKAILSMQHGLIPRSLHSEELNEKIDWASYPVKVAREPVEWGKNEQPRRAGISGFGITGTNAHVILEEAPDKEELSKEGELPARACQLVPVSGEGKEALLGQISALKDYILSDKAPSLEELAYSLATTRSHFRTQQAFIAQNREDLIQQLSSADLPTNTSPGKVAFLFTGQGAQYIEMGKGLYDTEPFFKATLDTCFDLIQSESGKDLKSYLFAPANDEEADLIHQTTYTQPVLFAIEYSLARLWQHWGVTPDILMGHSLGELVAATIAGVFSPNDGMKLAVARGRLMGLQPQTGKMVSVRADKESVARHLTDKTAMVSIAAENGPRQTVISGDTNTINELMSSFEAEGIKVKELKTSHAFHSPLMDPVLNDFRRVAETISYSHPSIPLVSNVNGRLAGEEVQKASYWTNHIRTAVLFSTGMQTLEAQGVTTYLEVGPQQVLTGMGTHCVGEEDQYCWIHSLQKDQPDQETMLGNLARWYASGRDIDWENFYQNREQSRVALPTYAFQRARHWVEKRKSHSGGKSTGHLLLGSEFVVAGQRVYEQTLDLKSYTYFSDHQVFGKLVVPGAAMAELVQGFISQLEGTYQLAELLVESPMIFLEDEIQVQLITESVAEGNYNFSIYSKTKKADWQRNASGLVEAADEDLSQSVNPASIIENLKPEETDDLYNNMESAGVSLGPAFQVVKEAYRNQDRLVGRVELGNTDVSGYQLHPTLLDGIFQLSSAFKSEEDLTAFLPFEIRGYQLSNTAADTVWAEFILIDHSENIRVFSINFWDRSGKPLGSVEEFKLRKVEASQLEIAGDWPQGDWLFTTDWQHISLEKDISSEESWTLLSNDTSTTLAQSLLTGAKEKNIPLEVQDSEKSITKDTKKLINLWEAPEVSGEMPVVIDKMAVQALEQLQWAVNSGVEEVLWVVKGLFAENDPANLIFAPVAGLFQVAGQEYPEVRFRLVGIDETSLEDHEKLLDVLQSENTGQQIRITANGVEGLRLIPGKGRLKSQNETKIPLLKAPKATVLITGGLGALGLKVAEHFAREHKVAHLLLLGRNEPGLQAQRTLEEIASLGTELTIKRCDVSDAAALSEVIESIPDELPLKGVVHAAGVLDDGVLDALTSERLLEVMKPKVRGGWHLHDATKEMDLELFLLFSSAASVLGGTGQGNYIAANTFLDHLATYRVACGLPALSINWGPVSDTGLAANLSKEEKNRIEKAGLSYFSSKEGVPLIDQVAHAEASQMGIFPLRKHQFKRSLKARFNKIPSFYDEVLTPDQKESSNSFIDQLQVMEEQQRASFFTAFLRDSIAGMLATEAGAISLTEPLEDLGVNSLIAIELRNMLSTQLGLKLPATLIFDHPSIDRLSTYLMSKISGAKKTAITKADSLIVDREEPIAIIGMSCRFPGGANDPEGLWHLLSNELEGIVAVPEDRWDMDRWYDPVPGTAGKIYAREGGFLEDIETFDAGFFRITPQEARNIDPQQRLLLECSWEALERAGLDQKEMLGTNTGAYFGICSADYQHRIKAEAGTEADGYAILGTAHSAIAGRISYWLGLNGPNMAIDTACSSSLVSLHLAVQALRNGECDQALAGGANVIISPESSVYFSQLKALSPTGHCHTFSNKADGYVRSEGAGVLVLKPLSKAKADGDNILALIKGSSVNQDGKSQGFTAPNGPSQESVISKALQQSNLSPEQIDYVECHGTGTDLGDPIEVQALGEVHNGRKSPLVLGSIKSNIGHAEGAAGVAGVIKTVLSMQHGMIPKSLHSEELNEKIDWEAYPVKVAQDAIPWEKNGSPRRAGVSSFGISGTNAHIVLEEAPTEVPEEVEETKLPARPYQLLTVSGEGEDALQGQLAKLKTHIESHPEQSPEALAYSLSTTRSHFRSRLGLVVSDKESLLSKLSGPIHPIRTSPGKLAFLYTGGGSQYTGMAKELYETEKTFATTFDQCLSLIQQETGEDFKQIIFASASTAEAAKLDQIDYMLLALFAVEYSLTRLWQSWGIEPDILMGHSLGELVAATVAGVFSLEDGIRLVAARGKLMASVKQAGKMATVEASIAELQPYLDKETSVSVAGENGPRQTLISGAAAGIESIADQLKNSDIKAKVLPISQASHSPLMEEILPAFRQVAGQVTYHAPQYPIISNVSGRLAGEEIQSPDYWTDHIRQTVLFSSGMQTLEQEGVTTYLEMGAEPSLVGMGGHCVTNSEDCQWLASLQSEGSDTEVILKSVAALYEVGYAPNWNSFYQDREQEKVPLPTYAFQRKRHWIDEADNVSGGRATGHALLGSELNMAGTSYYEKHLNVRDAAFLSDHKVQGKTIVPAAALAELVQGFISEKRIDAWIAELLIERPLAIPDSGIVQLQLVTREEENDRFDFTIHSREGEADVWQQNASGSIEAEAVAPFPDLDVEELKADLQVLDIAELYDDFESIAISYGPLFQVIEEAYSDENRVFGRVKLRAEEGDYNLHPTLLDGVFQLLAGIQGHSFESTYLPFEINGYALKHMNPREIWTEVSKTGEENSQVSYQIRVWDNEGQGIGEIATLKARKLDLGAFEEPGLKHRDWLYTTSWEPVTLESGTLAEGTWQLTGEESSSLLEALSTHLNGQEIQQLTAPVQEGTYGLISLWEGFGLDSGLPETTAHITGIALEQLKSAVHAGVEEVVWVTRDVFNTSVESGLMYAPLWGLVRAAMQEHPGIRFRLIDLEKEVSDSRFVEAICSATREDQLKLGVDSTEGLRLVPGASVHDEQDHNQGALVSGNGTLLITGGLGALGLKTAQYFAQEHKVSHLILAGRNTPGEKAKHVIDELTSSGTKVTVASCDVSDRAAVSDLIDGIPEEQPLKGIIHAAGVLDDGILESQTKKRLHEMMLPKVHGSWNLHELTRDLELDLFVVYSSFTSITGSSGQTGYAAANVFVDALAVYRQNLGLPIHCINWGPVADVGLAAALDKEEKARISRLGIGYFSSAAGLEVMAQVLSGPGTSMAIAPIRKNRLSQVLQANHGSVPAFYTRILHDRQSSEKTSLTGHLQQLDQSQRVGYLNTYLREQVATVVGRNPMEIPVEESLKSLGINSLMAIELRNQLSRQLGLKLPATLMFDYPIIQNLSEYLISRVLEDPKQSVSKRSKTYSHTDEPIAIIGMGCRFPGGATNPEEFWKLLSEGRDAIGHIPTTRWDVESIYSEEPGVPGKMNTREAGLLKDIDQFDAGFFGITETEAKNLDPQHRILMETAWQAIESAGLTKSGVFGTDTGVFMGLMSHEYENMQSGDMNALTGFAGLGSAGSVLTGRLSYWLGLKGPSVTIDTACSSSLVAMDMAVEKLHNGSCDMAIAGGVSLILTPAMHIEFGMLQGIAKDGRCRTFSDQAHGTGWSEGCGVLILKPLSKAQADGDQIMALIKGSAVNQDGRSQGLTAPNGPSQVQVIQKALDRAKLSPNQVDYVEAHGTGTELGDPIEVQALGQAYSEITERHKPLILGAVKSNLGHTMAAAGVAGVIKTVLSMKHGQIPKSLHCDELNKKIDWEAYLVKVAREALPWDKNGTPRRAGVSSFGISGTNAHIILEEAPEQGTDQARKTSDLPGRAYELVTISGEGDKALKAQAKGLKLHLEKHPEQTLEALAYNLSTKRTHFRNRQAFVSSDRTELLSRLGSPISEDVPTPGKLAFLFTGQGAQYEGMGKWLYDSEPVYRDSINQCLALVRQITDEHFYQSLSEELTGKPVGNIHQTEYTQPGLFVMEYSLSKLWHHWGVIPNLLIGHSLGELVAATVAGVFSLEDGIRLVTERGRLMGALPQEGKMMSVRCDRSTLEKYLEACEGKVSIAAENGPQQMVVSGEDAAIDKLEKLFKKESVKTRVLNTSHAFHSALMEPALESFLQVAEQVSYHAPQYPIVSNLTGELAGDEILTAAYWIRHIRETVSFNRGMQTLEKEGVTRYLEIGPEPVLTGMGAYCVSNSEECIWLASVKSDIPETETMLSSLGALFESGLNPDWRAFYQGRQQSPVTLPAYPFQRKSYWIDIEDTSSGGKPVQGALLGRELTIGGELIYEKTLDLNKLTYLKDHRVYGNVIFPAAGIAELVQEFIAEQGLATQMDELLIVKPVTLSERPTQVQLVTSKTATDSYQFSVFAKDEEDNWERCANGMLSAAFDSSDKPADIALLTKGMSVVDRDELYDKFESTPIHYGQAFQTVSELYVDEGRVVGKLVRESNDQEGYQINPALLDGVFQLAGQLSFGEDEEVYLPFELDQFQLKTTNPDTLWAELTLQSSDKDQKVFEVSLWDHSGRWAGKVGALKARKTDTSQWQQEGRSVENQWVYTTDWEEVSVDQGGYAGSNWAMISSQESDLGRLILSDIQTAGLTCERLDFEQSAEPNLDGLICVWPGADVKDSLPEAVSDLATTALLQLQQAANSGVQEITWVTEGAFDDKPNLVSAPLWGMLRVAMQENPHIRFRLIDCEAGRVDLHQQVLNVVRSDSSEAQWRVDSQGIKGLRLVSSAALMSTEIEADLESFISEDSSVLITGGLGALGMKVAEHFASAHKVGTLILLGRSEPKPETVERIATIEKSGTRVIVKKCDVSDQAGLAEIIRKIPADCPLKGVIHTAGVLEDGVIASQSTQGLKRVLAPKVHGAWILHELTRSLDLDFFVLFSSMASLLGSPGQANYAAANAFLDGLITYRGSQGLPVSGINWGPVSQVGLAADLGIDEKTRIEERGIGFLPVDQGLNLLDRALSLKVNQIALLPMKKRKFRQSLENAFGRVPDFFSEVLESGQAPEQNTLTKQIRELPAEQRSSYLVDMLRKRLGEVLGLAGAGTLALDKPIIELGLDSLKAIELRNQLSRKLDLKLPATLIFDYPTISDLSGFILNEMDFEQEIEVDWKHSITQFIQSQNADLSVNLEDDQIAATLDRLTTLLKRAEEDGQPVEQKSAGDIDEFTDDEIDSTFDELMKNELD